MPIAPTRPGEPARTPRTPRRGVNGSSDLLTHSYESGPQLGCPKLEWLATEVGALQILALQQLSGSAGENDLAGGQDVAAVGDRQRHGGVLLNHQHGHPGQVHVLDDLEVLLYKRRREAHGHHLLFAAREGARELSSALEQAREERVDPVEVLVQLLPSAQDGAELEVLPDGELAEEPAVL